MEAKIIKYRKGYKYQLAGPYSVNVDIRPELDIITNYIELYKDGLLTVVGGYAWDGCSGPTWDDNTNMRGGLVHDALYQLMRLGLLPQSCKEAADRELQRLCIEDGMMKARAWYYYKAVQMFGCKSCSLGYNPYPVLTAPKA